MKSLALLLALATAGVLPALAHQHAAHAPAGAQAAAPAGVRVEHCWIRAMPASLPSAGYFTVVNEGDKPAQLVGIASEAFGKTMLHETRTSEGMARMVMTHSVDIPAGGKLSFAPGGHHAMLEQSVAPLTVGESVPVELQFEGGGKVKTDCTIKPASATAH
jgi:copper(I)-binding protein